MSNLQPGRRFVREALALLSSYFYSDQVLLEPKAVEIGENAEDEFDEFAKLLRIRHAIACGLKMKPIVEAIERGISQTSEVVRTESKGAIRGRLDISLYLSRRDINLSWPRTFPVLVTEATPNTPENQLVVQTLRQLTNRLNLASIEEDSAERIYSLNLLRWSRERLHLDPWSRVIPSRNAGRLQRESNHRLRKRQTGNDVAYARFLTLYEQWVFDASQSNQFQLDEFVNILFAFPPGDFFEDRVFEIWCLHQVIEGFRRCGAVVIEGPRSLSVRSHQAICKMTYDTYAFEIWFQKALPPSRARWKYVHSQRPLAGIPDITVIGHDNRNLLIDAKRRLVRTQTRSEETYKMLGYLENFRSRFEGSTFWAALCFLSDDDLFTEIVSEQGHKIVLVGAHTEKPEICAFGGRMDTFLSEWLSERPYVELDITMGSA